MPNKYKVLVVAPSIKTRGGITAVVNAYSKSSLWRDWNCYWVESHIDKGVFLKILFFFKAMLMYLIRLPSAQIVHIHLSQPVSAIRKMFFFIPAFVFKKKIILHFHAFSPDSTIDGKFRIIYEYMFKNADRVIVLSQTWKNALEKSLGSNIKIVIVYNPSIAPAESLVDNFPIRLPQVLFAGTLNSRKGYSDLINAFSMVSTDFNDWTLVFAGNGEISEGLALARKLGIENKVIFKGWVKGPAKEKLFLSSSIFCLPSYAEGFPMALLDAMAYSIPTIATPVGGTLDVFTKDEDLLIFNPGDVIQLSICLRELINDHELRDKISSNAKKIINRDFVISSIAKKIDQIYLSVVKE